MAMTYEDFEMYAKNLWKISEQINDNWTIQTCRSNNIIYLVKIQHDSMETISKEISNKNLIKPDNDDAKKPLNEYKQHFKITRQHLCILPSENDMCYRGNEEEAEKRNDVTIIITQSATDRSHKYNESVVASREDINQKILNKQRKLVITQTSSCMIKRNDQNEKFHIEKNIADVSENIKLEELLGNDISKEVNVGTVNVSEDIKHKELLGNEISKEVKGGIVNISEHIKHKELLGNEIGKEVNVGTVKVKAPLDDSNRSGFVTSDGSLFSSSIDDVSISDMHENHELSKWNPSIGKSSRQENTNRTHGIHKHSQINLDISESFGDWKSNTYLLHGTINNVPIENRNEFDVRVVNDKEKGNRSELGVEMDESIKSVAIQNPNDESFDGREEDIDRLRMPIENTNECDGRVESDKERGNRSELGVEMDKRIKSVVIQNSNDKSLDVGHNKETDIDRINFDFNQDNQDRTIAIDELLGYKKNEFTKTIAAEAFSDEFESAAYKENKLVENTSVRNATAALSDIFQSAACKENKLVENASVRNTTEVLSDTFESAAYKQNKLVDNATESIPPLLLECEVLSEVENKLVENATDIIPHLLLESEVLSELENKLVENATDIIPHLLLESEVENKLVENATIRNAIESIPPLLLESEILCNEMEIDMEHDLATCNIHNQTSAMPITLAYHILYSFSYNVPVIYFNVWNSNGSLLDLEQVWKLFNFHNDPNKWTIMTQAEHPYLRKPFYQLHPCGTQKLIEILSNSNESHDIQVDPHIVNCTGNILIGDIPERSLSVESGSFMTGLGSDESSSISDSSKSNINKLILWISCIAPYVRLKFSLEYATFS